jgi:hypothetical protein
VSEAKPRPFEVGRYLLLKISDFAPKSAVGTGRDGSRRHISGPASRRDPVERGAVAKIRGFRAGTNYAKHQQSGI